MSQDVWFIDRLQTWRAGEYRWVPRGEVIVVAGAECELSSGFEGEGTVAVQLNSPIQDLPPGGSRKARDCGKKCRVIPKVSPCITLPTRSLIDESLFAP
jgi:hypothetical protein